jgi:hypothetical protein
MTLSKVNRPSTLRISSDEIIYNVARKSKPCNSSKELLKDILGLEIADNLKSGRKVKLNGIGEFSPYTKPDGTMGVYFTISPNLIQYVNGELNKQKVN